MLNRRKITFTIFVILFCSLPNTVTSVQTDFNLIHEYDLVDLEIEGKINGGFRDEFVFQELDQIEVNVSQSELIIGLYETLLVMRLYESKNGIIILPEKGYMDNSTGLKGEMLIFNITINQIHHGNFENYPSSVAFVNPTLTRFSDFIQGFGLIISIVLIAVLFKTIFDYLKIRNQSQLIIR